MLNPVYLGDAARRATSQLDFTYLDFDYPGNFADNQSRLSIEDHSPATKKLSDNVEAYHNANNSRQPFGSCVAGVHDLQQNSQTDHDAVPQEPDNREDLAPTSSLMRHHRSAQKMNRQFGLSMQHSPNCHRLPQVTVAEDL